VCRISFDQADAGFIGAYRSSHFTEDRTIVKGYTAMPNLNGKTAVIIDPMLATGNSILECIDDISNNYKPAKIHVLALLATPAGIANLEKSIKIPFEIWTVAIDEELNDNAYIVPGLGDAGDLAFGPKE
jgi:uracil phosphoribosyltransferase